MYFLLIIIFKITQNISFLLTYLTKNANKIVEIFSWNFFKYLLSITIKYITNGSHIITPSLQLFLMWDSTLTISLSVCLRIRMCARNMCACTCVSLPLSLFFLFSLSSFVLYIQDISFLVRENERNSHFIFFPSFFRQFHSSEKVT